MYYYNEQVKEDEIGEECSTHGREMHTKFWQEDLNERDHCEDLGIDERILTHSHHLTSCGCTICFAI
jgi:hypothetical protein